jgi:TatD DNase family protein
MTHKYIDIHTHYSYKEKEIIKNIFLKEDIIALCSSTDIQSYIDLKNLKQEKINGLFFSYGLYPDVINNNTFEECVKNIQKIDFDDCLAIGEIGLDYKITKDKIKREFQKKVFEKQLEIAESLNKPVVVHSRFATKQVLEILDGYKMPVILHWFSGSENQIKDAFSRGYYLTINFDRTTIEITKENISQIFIETDYPIPYNNISNILNIKKAYQIVANKNTLTINYLKENIQNNFCRLFNIKI